MPVASMTARELHRRWLAGHFQGTVLEIRSSAGWQRVHDLGLYRRRGTPLLVYLEEFPQGKCEVPMDTEVWVRF